MTGHTKVTLGDRTINTLRQNGIFEAMPLIVEMYIQGVSTRRFTPVMEKLCGMEVTSCQVSRLTAQLDAEFELWRYRALPEIAYLFFDATCIKVCLDGAVRDCAVLIAIGIRRCDRKRMARGFSAAIAEAEPHWRIFTRCDLCGSACRLC